MTSSQTAESVTGTQPIAPVATMSTAIFNPDNKLLITQAPDPHEINGLVSEGEEPTTQPIQKLSQTPPVKPLDSFPFCAIPSNALAGADQMPYDLSQDALHLPEGMKYTFDHDMQPQSNVAPNDAFHQQSWDEPWDANQINTADSGVQLDGFAKLVFDDSAFYMTTHEVIIGRDMSAQNNMTRYEKEQAQLEQAWHAFDPSRGDSNQATVDARQPRRTIMNINASAGILESWMPLQEKRNRKGKKHKTSKSANLLSQSGSGNSPKAGSLLPLLDGNIPIQNPDPHSCPIVRVHPPFDKGLAGFKTISREHVKIFYDDDHEIFKVKFIGRNGGFVDGTFYECEQIAPLMSGSKLQMGYIYVTFMLPDFLMDGTGFQYQEDPEEEATTGTIYSEGGKEMSLNFDGAPRAGDQRSTDNSECSSIDGNAFARDEFTDSEEETADNAGEVDNEVQLEKENSKQQDVEEDEEMLDNFPTDSPTDASPRPAKKRGPGRPPKNGVMSKREQQLAKKEALERERIQEEERVQEEQRIEDQSQATASKTVPGTKNKVGRPRKHPRPEVSEKEPLRKKRKYTKRLSGPKEPEEVDEDKFDDDGNCIQTKRGSSRKVAYVLKIVNHVRSECTLEQLNKPPKNYLQVIWELLRDAGCPLCLPQIYNEMEVQYPYYAFQDSKGWQSSVRHNLGQHDCFLREKRAGKGWAWTLKEGTSYVREKKKKAPSPPVAGRNQPIYQASHPVPGYGANQIQPPPGYMFNPQLYQGQMNSHPPPQAYQQYQQAQTYMGPPNPHYAPYPAQQGYAPPQGVQAPFIPPMAPQLVPTAPASYSSPYAPKPPAATTQPQGIQQPPQQQYPQQQYPQQYPQQPHYQPQGLPQPPNTSQSPVLPQQPRLPAGNRIPTPPQAAPQAAPAPIHQKRVIPPNLIAVVMGYRNHVVNLMRQKAPQNDAEALVDKAIKRVYDGTEDDRSLDSTEHEMKLINGVLNVLKLPLVPRTPPANPSHTQRQQSAPQQPSQQSANQNKPQGNTSQQPVKANGPDLPKQTIMRPSLYGNNLNQSTGSSVPRPPLMTPGLQRTNSGSHQIAPARPNTASSSSAPANSSNPSQAAVSSSNKTGGATPPVANTVNQTIAQVVDQNGTNNGLKVGETLTEAGFVRSFPQPQITT
ncbi:hypothetical protein SBOR_2058 [Sclerotinia borealis F-4128]|uniref:Fork-head domain-containing protein n=1 Tax=Sclerotinia borealis (strain F-4128) TaxID=1432307 RepID=W9CNT6_SCLBF|nr:hypothetical protein SBOR_2058 [Sclerotinia borealis F-4128]